MRCLYLGVEVMEGFGKRTCNVAEILLTPPRGELGYPVVLSTSCWGPDDYSVEGRLRHSSFDAYRDAISDILR